ncbi:MAG: GDSL-type esterase/lipase family protein [Planctomycetota bacterium]
MTARASKRVGRWSRRLAALLLGTVAAIVLGEGAYRLLEPTPYRLTEYVTVDGREIPPCEAVNLFGRIAEQELYLPKPHAWLPAGLRVRMRYDRPRAKYFDTDGSIPLSFNSLGFRDDEFAAAKPAGELRILAIGDSFTYGWGVRIEDAWPQRLERDLARDRPRGVQVMNAGLAVRAATPDGYDRWLESDGLLLGPDLVIVGLCLNDMGEVPMLAYPIVPPQPVLGGWSRALDAAWREIRQARVRNEHRDLSDIVAREPKYWNATQAALKRMRDMLVARRIPFLVVVFPMFSQLDRDYPYARLHVMATRFCLDAGIECLDLGPRFVGTDADHWTVHPTDQHPNDLAHAEFAIAIAGFLRDRGLLPR